MFVSSVQAVFFFKIMRTQEKEKLDKKSQYELEYDLMKKFYLKYKKENSDKVGDENDETDVEDEDYDAGISVNMDISSNSIGSIHYPHTMTRNIIL